MPIPFRLDYVIDMLSEPNDEQRLLKEWAGIKLKPREARAAWKRILDHKWYISERLGRDVGFRVAAIDYFENIWSRPNRTYIGWLPNIQSSVAKATTFAV